MTHALPYVVLGRGRWARRMSDILSGEARPTVCLENTRCAPGERDDDYESRLVNSIRASGARIAWLCVPPGPHILPMLDAVFEAGLHAVIEKPWLFSRSQTDSVLAKARARRVIAGVHYEYCLLDGVEDMRRRSNRGTGLEFCGRFTISRPQRLPVSALEDLGSHLLAIRAYAAPESSITDVRCGYERPDERQVWLEARHQRVFTVDFLANQKPIIQRFIGVLEAAIEGAEFPFGLEFASQVADGIEKLKRLGSG
ncbi:MAG: hypothetical protein ACRD4R_04580 [Candidatus Acidiferrales bacterium]